MDAKVDLKENRKRLRPAEERILNHPYTRAVREGRVAVEALRAFPCHQYHMANSDIRSVALLVSRYGASPSRTFFNNVLQGELAAPEAIVVMARRLGLSEEDLQAYEPDPGGFAYAAYLAWICGVGSAAEVACGMFVNLAAWGHNCGELSQGLRKHYGFSGEDTAFLDAFASLPSSEDEALEIVQDGLNQGVAVERIYQTSRMFQAYEEMFWDTMARLANI